jgi:hypothetical protein
MGELMDFLVWLQREKKAGRISSETVKVVGYSAFEYLRSKGKQSQYPQEILI